MTSSAVNSIIARCITDAQFLEQLHNSPLGTLSKYQLSSKEHNDFLNLDLDSLGDYVGLITKVQNNGLWQWFRYTRNIMDYYELDLDIFREFSHIHQYGRARKQNRDTQTRNFVSHVKDYLGVRDADAFPGLSDVLQYEYLMWKTRVKLDSIGEHQIHRAHNCIPDEEIRSSPRFQINGVIYIDSFQFEWKHITQLLQQSDFTPKKLQRAERIVGFWGDARTMQLRMLELEPDVALLLSNLSETHSIDQVIRDCVTIFNQKFSESHFHALLNVAIEHGIVIPH